MRPQGPEDAQGEKGSAEEKPVPSPRGHPEPAKGHPLPVSLERVPEGSKNCPAVGRMIGLGDPLHQKQALRPPSDRQQLNRGKQNI